MRTFVKKQELQLLNGGFLSDKKGNPVSNQSFVEIQKHAEYIITFAQLAKGKDLKGKEAYSLKQLKEDVSNALSKKSVSYLSQPEKINRELTDKLKKEALSFMSYQSDLSKVEKINKSLQQFNLLKEFEEFGLFFEQDIVKLNKIYTVDEVVEAVSEVIDLL
jgi:hypothetical protein